MKRKPEDVFCGCGADCSGTGALCARSVAERGTGAVGGGESVAVRFTVVSRSGGGGELPGTARYARTASRICSSAADRSWKYAKKYESTEYCSFLSTTFTSIVSLKSIAVDFSTSTIAEYGIAI